MSIRHQQDLGSQILSTTTEITPLLDQIDMVTGLISKNMEWEPMLILLSAQKT